jgi:hypothetical protein
MRESPFVRPITSCADKKQALDVRESGRHTKGGLEGDNWREALRPAPGTRPVFHPAPLQSAGGNSLQHIACRRFSRSRMAGGTITHIGTESAMCSLRVEKGG